MVASLEIKAPKKLPGSRVYALQRGYPSASTVLSPWVGPARQDESLDFMSVAEAEALVEDHSPLETVKDLPPFTALSAPNFRWGDISGTAFSSKVNKAYEEAVHWKRNLFEIPRGKAGMEFVRELSRLLDAYTDATALESIALKAPLCAEIPNPGAHSLKLQYRCTVRVECRILSSHLHKQKLQQ